MFQEQTLRSLASISRRLGEAIVPSDVTANHIIRHYNLEECVNSINDAMYRKVVLQRLNDGSVSFPCFNEVTVSFHLRFDSSEI